MGQSELSAPSLGEVDRATHWEPSGSVGEPAIDIWSRLPTPQADQPTMTASRAANRASIEHVLSAWRAAERQLGEEIEASPARSLIQAEIARLRLEYQRLFAQALR